MSKSSKSLSAVLILITASLVAVGCGSDSKDAGGSGGSGGDAPEPKAMSENEYVERIEELSDSVHVAHAPSTREWYDSAEYKAGRDALDEQVYDADSGDYEQNMKAFEQSPVGKAYDAGNAKAATVDEGVWRAMVGSVDPKEILAFEGGTTTYTGDDAKVLSSITMKQVAAAPIDELRSDVEEVVAELEQLTPPESRAHEHELRIAQFEAAVPEAEERIKIASGFTPANAVDSWIAWKLVGDERPHHETDLDYDGLVDDASNVRGMLTVYEVPANERLMKARLLQFSLYGLASTGAQISLVEGRPEAGLLLDLSSFRFECYPWGDATDATVDEHYRYVPASGKQCSSFTTADANAALAFHEASLVWTEGIDVTGDADLTKLKQLAMDDLRSTIAEYREVAPAMGNAQKLAALNEQYEGTDSKLYEQVNDIVDRIEDAEEAAEDTESKDSKEDAGSDGDDSDTPADDV